jgi:hypothetical protein
MVSLPWAFFLVLLVMHLKIVEAANRSWTDHVRIRSTTQQQQSGSVYFQQTASRRDQTLHLWWPLVLTGKNEDSDGCYVCKIGKKICHSLRISHRLMEMHGWILTWLTSPVESEPTSHGHWANDWGKHGCDSDMWSRYSYQLSVTCLSWRNVPKKSESLKKSIYSIFSIISSIYVK